MAKGKGNGMSEVKVEINGINFDVKEIKPDKIYALETEYMLKPEQAESILNVWQQVTGAKAMLLDCLKIEESVQRVRELHRPVPCTDDDGCCQICDYCGYMYPCVTIKVLDGEQNEPT